jgi:leucyl aminopeptidase
MKAKFTVTAGLKLGDDHSIQFVETPMLMVTQFAGMRISADFKALIDSTDGAYAKAVKRGKFTGDAGQSVVVALGRQNLPQDSLVVIGLGRAQPFGCREIRMMMRKVVDAAVSKRVDKVTIPFLPRRTTSSNLSLSQTAHIMRCVAVDVLESKKSDRELEIEFYCTSQARRHVQSGLDRKRRCHPCKDSD